MSQWTPNLIGQVTPETEKAIGQLFKTQGDLQSQLNASQSGISSPEFFQTIANALQVNGAAPLNITGLIGLPQGINQTVPQAKLTPGGTNGSITFIQGIATSAVDPT